MTSARAELVQISHTLSSAVDRLRFKAPVRYTYNPLIYARVPHERYLQTYGARPREVLLLGMNPGPFGMVQTGVPFGDVKMVREFLGVIGPVGRPAREHPKRPVLGFECQRSEVSGTRLWGWVESRFRTPDKFFERFFVANYCPLAFLEQSGRNKTPDKLPAGERMALFEACDDALRRVVRHLDPRAVIGIGGFAAERARIALAEERVALGSILHPSPANPRANRGWANIIENQLLELGIKVC